MANPNIVRWIVSISFVIASTIGIVMSVPLWLGKIPPNRTTGFRTPATLSDPTLWYQVNTATGRSMVILSCVVLVMTLALHFTLARNKPSIAALVLTFTFAIGALLVTAQGFWIIRAGT